ncbi:MAG: 3'-5' exonuclease [Sphaerochaetaceae bacterium]
MRTVKYVAIDFETANDALTSACSVGLAKMEGAKVLETYYTLLKPPSPYFSPKNSQIHGLSNEDVKDAPNFAEVWPSMVDFIDKELLIAHNAPFDSAIVRALAEFYSLKLPNLRYTCTLKIARKKWVGLHSYSLAVLSAYFAFPYHAHHALEDAINCGLIFNQALPFQKERDVLKELERLAVPLNYLTGGVAPYEVEVNQGTLL